ncbi:hypothetical protein [Parvularcula maris]|uniref:Uncharacterized protein n=1 Tax=Parvularcula maris TaxID=2965077 RepID=A0A9X2L929_9PROT|nr:hypothetical protein [Parvularcula maris]MCQ8185216.1 hypothetical protein [Parvularcula maris]
MKSLDERVGDYAEKLSLGLLLAAFVSPVPAYARAIFLIASLFAACAMVVITQNQAVSSTTGGSHDRT